MSFLKELEDDLKECFLNEDEFAERLVINGTERTGILDYRDNVSSNERNDGVTSSDEAFLYVKENPELEGSRYRKGKSIEVNDDTFIIVSIVKHQGMLSFKLNRNEGY